MKSAVNKWCSLNEFIIKDMALPLSTLQWIGSAFGIVTAAPAQAFWKNKRRPAAPFTHACTPTLKYPNRDNLLAFLFFLVFPIALQLRM